MARKKVTKRHRDRRGKREITILCDSVVEWVWACWQTAEAERYKELGGAAERERGSAICVARKTIWHGKDEKNTCLCAAVLQASSGAQARD